VALAPAAEEDQQMSGRDHFSLHASGKPTAEGRFVRAGDLEPISFAPGLDFRPVLGERMLANFAYYEHTTDGPCPEADVFSPPRASLLEQAEPGLAEPGSKQVLSMQLGG
jgi:hypothetical protein